MLLRAIVFAAFLLPSAVFAQDECSVDRLVRVQIQPSAFPSLPGQTVTFRVFVEPVQGIAEPTGDVQVSDGTTDLGTFTLKQMQFSFTRTFTESGAHIIRAAYPGDLLYCSVTATFGQQVDHLTPTVTLSSSAASADAGSPVTLTAQIGPAPPAGVAAPVGPVQFVEGTTVLGSAAVVSGKAALTLTNLSGGTHQIAAVLVGDAVWFQVRSAAITQTIGRAPTTTTLTAAAGVTSSTLTSIVSTGGAGSPAVDGTVTFIDTVSNQVFGTAVLPAAGMVTVTLSAQQVLAAVGHPIQAVYSGSATFAPSTSASLGIPVAANSASGATGAIAPEEIVSLYGWQLSATTLQAGVLPLPTTLDGNRVTVTDSAGTARDAGIYLVSPGQFNFVIPAGTLPGTAVIAVTRPGLVPPIVPIRVNVVAVAPGLYTTSSDGKGLPAAQLIRVRADGSQTTESVTADGIRIGGDTVYLVLYGTGIRNRSSLAGVTCNVGTVVYAGAQSESPGLDQVNVLLPVSLAGKGDTPLTLSVDGQGANSVTLKVIG